MSDRAPVDPQPSDPLDEVARRRSRVPLVRAVIATIVALGGMVAASTVGDIDAAEGSDDYLIAIGGAAVLLLAGIVAVRAISTAVRRATEHRLGKGRSTALGLVISALGYLLVVLTALPIFGVDLEGLLLGGALTGVALGIAAQQTLGNFFAGMLLLLVRPFAVGDQVVLKSGLGEYEGVVTDMGLFYLKLETESGGVALPNAAVLGSAVGPGARSPKT